MSRYARCTKIASLPAPLYYAHLAAKKCPMYAKDGFREVSDMWEQGSTSSGEHSHLVRIAISRSVRRSYQYYTCVGARLASTSGACTYCSSSSTYCRHAGGSRGSQKSRSNYEPLHEKQASRLYYC
jgi:hypothetical protein